MDRNLTDQEREKIINFGAFGYKSDIMSTILEIGISDIDELMKDTKSEFYLLYKKGEAISRYLLDVKIFDMAKSGDLKAIERYERSRRLSK
jgi:hypothetical protein